MLGGEARRAVVVGLSGVKVRPRWGKAALATGLWSRVFGVAVWGAACTTTRAPMAPAGPVAPAPTVAAPDSLPVPAARRAQAAAERPARLEIRLRPRPKDEAGSVDVSIALRGSTGSLGSWQVPRRLAQSLSLRVRREPAACDASAAPGTPTAVPASISAAPGATLDLTGVAGACVQRLVLEYGVQLPTSGGWSARLDPTQFTVEGREILVLPEHLPTEPIDTSLQIDAGEYGPDGRAVSSLGIGSNLRARLTRHALEGAVFAAGYFGTAVFDAPEGHDETAWFGSPLFDPRPLATEVASFRTAVREMFRTRELPLTQIVTTDASLLGFDVRRAPASVLVRVTPGQALTAPLRLSILHQVLKEWIGAQLAVVDAQGADQVWFSEGFCRHLARQLAFELGLITGEEYAQELDALMSIQSVLHQGAYAPACSPLAPPPLGPLAGCRELLALARGALHAGVVDAALRARQRSLVTLLRGLLADHKGTLTTDGWVAALRESAGEAPARGLLELLQGRNVLPSSDTFGPCFARVQRTYAQATLGFDYEPAPGQPGGKVTQLAPGSPAFAAGLRPGAAFRAIDFVPYQAERPIRIWLEGGELVEYKGSRRPLSGLGWRRVPGLRDERCVQPASGS